MSLQRSLKLKYERDNTYTTECLGLSLRTLWSALIFRGNSNTSPGIEEYECLSVLVSSESKIESVEWYRQGPNVHHKCWVFPLGCLSLQAPWAECCLAAGAQEMPWVSSRGLCSLRVPYNVRQNVVNVDDKVEKWILNLKQNADVDIPSVIL